MVSAQEPVMFIMAISAVVRSPSTEAQLISLAVTILIAIISPKVSEQEIRGLNFILMEESSKQSLNTVPSLSLEAFRRLDNYCPDSLLIIQPCCPVCLISRSAEF